MLAYLNGIAQSKIWCELKMPQPHPSDRACAVPLLQPPLDANAIIWVTGGNHDRIVHKLH